MNTRTFGRTLFVALAVLGLALAAPAVGAHGDAPATDEAPTADTNATDRSGWMLGEMTERLGPGAAERMASHAGMSGDWMNSSAHAAHDNHAHGDHHSDTTHSDHHSDTTHSDHHSDTTHSDHHSDTTHSDHHSSTGTHQQGHGR
ncbi:hypothetical protein [Halobellus ordinarius]|uniref:hypothetical protein n=1 Tax=Halobellus ordinarius TaxID=3075120 RepID=UPI0028800706|nr:hypothetical protein [Halobellus sp. ZY16]